MSFGDYELHKRCNFSQQNRCDLYFNRRLATIYNEWSVIAQDKSRCVSFLGNESNDSVDKESNMQTRRNIYSEEEEEKEEIYSQENFDHFVKCLDAKVCFYLY